MRIKINHTNLSDEELLQTAIAASNQDAFGQLYARYVPLVYGLCLKYLQQQEDAEDAVMQIYEEISLKFRKYEIANFRTWLYSVAKNHCLQQLRKTSAIFMEEFNPQIMETEPFLHLLDSGEDEEKEKALNYCIGILPEEQKTCVNYFFFDEQSYADIVALTGYALNQVKSYIQNGKRNLKNCIIKKMNLEH